MMPEWLKLTICRRCLIVASISTNFVQHASINAANRKPTFSIARPPRKRLVREVPFMPFASVVEMCL